MSESRDASLFPDDSSLVQITDDITRQLERGEQLDLQTYLNQFPQYAAELRQVIPAIRAMVTLGRPPVEDSTTAVANHHLVDQSLGDYRIVREIGRGGMGVVYEADQVSLGRRVALKILPFAALLNERQLERFATEATAAARLQHAHIVQVYTLGCERGIHFYAMQLIEGPSLAEVIAELRQKPYSESNSAASEQHVDTDTVADRAAALLTRDAEGDNYYRSVARIGREAAEGLQYAHQHGVLHRDIKPGNLLLDAAGHVRIADFGLARVEDESRLTRTGDVLGTLRYLSPEQATGQRHQIDARSDVYSLGATLYELATLEPVFDSTDPRQIVKQVVAGSRVPPHQIDHRVPRPLSSIISKTMSFRPADRYQSARELAADLQRFLDGQRVKAKTVTAARRASEWSRRHRWTAAATVTLLIVAFAATAMTWPFWQAVPDESQASVGAAESSSTAKEPPVNPEHFLALDSYANFFGGEPTYLGFGAIALQSDGKFIVTANAQPADSASPLTGGDHFVGRLNDDGSVDMTFGTGGFQRMDVLNDGVATLDYPGNPIVLPDGKILVCGTSGGDVAYQTTAWYIVKYHPDGTLDTAFGEGGMVFDTVIDVGVAKGFAMDVRSDGKIVAAGSLTRAGERGQCTVVQYNADGSRDTKFGLESGMTEFCPAGLRGFDAGYLAEQQSMTVLRNGRIAVTGMGETFDDRFVSSVVMFNEDGTVDTSFGDWGHAYVDTWPETGPERVGWEGLAGIVEQPDGKLLVCGGRSGFQDDGTFSYAYVRTMARFSADGSVDTSFGTDGVVIPAKKPGYRGEGYRAVALQSDQRIIAFGWAGHVVTDTQVLNDLTLERFNTDGSHDLSFDGTGRVEYCTPASQMLAQGLILDHGSIVIGSTHTDVETGGPSRILLLRLIPKP